MTMPDEVWDARHSGVSYAAHAEVAQGWASYDDRVDIFSMGIVAFELWHPFSTGMERVALLKDLQEHGALPAAWEAANPKVAALSGTPDLGCGPHATNG